MVLSFPVILRSSELKEILEKARRRSEKERREMEEEGSSDYDNEDISGA